MKKILLIGIALFFLVACGELTDVRVLVEITLQGGGSDPACYRCKQ